MSDVNEIPNGNNPLIEPDGTTARPNTLQEEAAELREKEARETQRG